MGRGTKIFKGGPYFSEIFGPGGPLWGGGGGVGGGQFLCDRSIIVVSFLPCFVAFWGFHPCMFFHFFKCYLFLLFFGGRRKV